MNKFMQKIRALNLINMLYTLHTYDKKFINKLLWFFWGVFLCKTFNNDTSIKVKLKHIANRLSDVFKSMYLHSKSSMDIPCRFRDHQWSSLIGGLMTSGCLTIFRYTSVVPHLGCPMIRKYGKQRRRRAGFSLAIR